MIAVTQGRATIAPPCVATWRNRPTSWSPASNCGGQVNRTGAVQVSARPSGGVASTAAKALRPDRTAKQASEVSYPPVASRSTPDSNGPAACASTCPVKRHSADRAIVAAAEIIRPGDRQHDEQAADAKAEERCRQVSRGGAMHRLGKGSLHSTTAARSAPVSSARSGVSAVRRSRNCQSPTSARK